MNSVKIENKVQKRIHPHRICICSICRVDKVHVSSYLPCYDENKKYIEDQRTYMCRKCIIILTKSNEFYCEIEKHPSYDGHFYTRKFPTISPRNSLQQCKNIIVKRAISAIIILSKNENSNLSYFPQDLINVIIELINNLHSEQRVWL